MMRSGKREFLTGAAIGVGVVLFAMFVLAPALAVHGIIGAARAGDAARLERQVDFPAFRASLKDKLNARMRAEIRADPLTRGTPWRPPPPSPDCFTYRHHS